MVVVAGQRRQAERNRMQAGRFRREVGPRGVGAAHDQSQPRQRRLAFQPEQLEHGVEAAAFALVRDFDIGDVERDAAEFLGRRLDIGRIDEQDLRIGVDEAADQPGAGDAVDLRPPPRHPDAGPSRREAFEGLAVDHRQPGVAPGEAAAFQHRGVIAGAAQFGGDELAQFLAGLAGNDDRALLVERRHPARKFGRLLPVTGWQQSRRGVVDVAPPHVDELRRIRRADQVPEFCR